MLKGVACLTSSVKDVPRPSCQERDVQTQDAARLRPLTALLQGQHQGLAAVFEELLRGDCGA